MGWGFGWIEIEKPVGGFPAVNVPRRNEGCIRGLIFASAMAILPIELCLADEFVGDDIARIPFSYRSPNDTLKYMSLMI